MLETLFALLLGVIWLDIYAGHIPRVVGDT